MPLKRRIPILIFLFLLTACAAPWREKETGPVRLTGFIEAASVEVAPEIAGRLVEVAVDEGDPVAAGQVVARLDDEQLRLQLALAEAEVNEAEARLAQLQHAVREVDVALAEAQVKQAEVALAAANQALADAVRLRDNPQMLDVQIAQARAALDEAKAHARAAEYQAQAADLEAEMWGVIVQDLRDGVDVKLPTGGVITVDAPPEKLDYANQQWNLASQAAWAAWEDVDAAKAAVKQAQTALDDLLRMKENPQEAEAQVVAATNARDEARSALEQARAQLDAVSAGPSQEQIDAAEAAVVQARAQRDALAAQIEKTALVAPVDGLVSARYRSSGEVIGPSQSLLTIAQPDALEITIFAPAQLLDSFAVGDTLPLVVDAAAGRRFSARVLEIRDEPEFTLRRSQNVAERADSVYAVRLLILDSDPLLRPGLPADILIEP
ncbi:MAG: biotin/lipoyl-binding protein [Chloroflexi bacterium]|nr:biotin/lipoyl-binding protein [Chloroflexota bacterium]